MDAIRFCHNDHGTLDCMVWDNKSANDQATDDNLRGILPFMPQVDKLYVTGSILTKILLLRSSTLIALKHIVIQDFDSRDLPKTGARLLTDVKSLRTASLSVSDSRLIFPLLPLKRLTHIELHSSVHCRGAFDFLQGCLNLQELTVREFTWAKYYPLELMGRHTILPNLKKLRVRLHRTPFRNLLGRIRIPYLESLELVTIDGPLSLNDIRIPLQGLRYLCISLKALAHAELIKLLSACRSLVSLTFVVQWEQGVLQSLMKALADYVVLLPIIQSFSLVFDGGDHFEEGFRSVTSLMRCWLQIGPRRRALTNVAFTLRTSGYEGRLSWQRSLKGLRHCLKMWIRTTDEKDGVLLSDEIVDLRGPQWTT
ncbi:hypothetical protein H0H93_003984 [Arthromyces matolae]|nr:hypothetical protein H0H93_003984 [Arthromyces matolae]